MCNHYANDLKKLGRFLGGMIGEQFSDKRIPLRFGNLPEHVYPNKPGVIVRKESEGLTAETMLWGFPSPLSSKTPYTTNLRHPEKPFWRPYLGPANRCLVPATSFFEYDERTRGQGRMKEVEFARPDGETFCFAGIWREYEGTRGTKSAPVTGTHRVFTFLTTEANAVVAPVHPKAMPVILGVDEAEAWLSYPADVAFETFQRPAEDDALVVVERPAEG
jgi:putative SOS response-associated peptidase YedK